MSTEKSARFPEDGATHMRSNPLTVAEMSEALSALDPNALLYVSGYESGFHDAALPREFTVCRNVNSSEMWFFGPHDEDGDGPPEIGYFIGRGA